MDFSFFNCLEGFFGVFFFFDIFTSHEKPAVLTFVGSSDRRRLVI